MNTAKKAAIIAAAICILAGLLLCLGAFASVDFDLSRMNTTTFTVSTYNVEEPFSGILVDCAECDVRVLPSDDGLCRVVCPEGSKITHTVTVENNTLTVKRTDLRKWYEQIGIYWGSPEAAEIVVYLPEHTYDSLHVTSLSGCIEIPAGISFAEAEIQSTSGDVHVQAAVAGALSVKTVSGNLSVSDVSPAQLDIQSTSGDIRVASVTLGTALAAKTVSGNLELTGLTCRSMTAESTSGNIDCSDVSATETLQAKSVSGNIRLRGCDAGSLWLKTTSGDVSGTLLTEKVFLTETTSGDVDVPRSVTGGTCEIQTTSGNISFSIHK